MERPPVENIGAAGLQILKFLLQFDEGMPLNYITSCMFKYLQTISEQKKNADKMKKTGRTKKWDEK